MEKIYDRNKKIIYRDGDKIIKSFSNSTKPSKVLYEALTQQKIYEGGLKCPKFYEVKMIDDRLSICMEYIDGVPLEKLILNEPQNTDKYMDMFVDTHISILSNSANSISNSYGKIKHKIFTSKLPSTTKFYLFYKLRTIDFTRDVMHGDLDLSNVILGKDNYIYVIDWSHAAFGNKIFDIAVSYAVFNINDQKEFAEIYLDKITNKLAIKREDVLNYLVLAYIYIVDRYDVEIQNKIYEYIDKEIS